MLPQKSGKDLKVKQQAVQEGSQVTGASQYILPSMQRKIPTNTDKKPEAETHICLPINPFQIQEISVPALFPQPS